MFLPAIFLLFALVMESWACPAGCLCSEDYEYPDGLVVDCENLGLDSVPMDIPGHTSTL